MTQTRNLAFAKITLYLSRSEGCKLPEDIASPVFFSPLLGAPAVLVSGHGQSDPAEAWEKAGGQSDRMDTPFI